MYKYSIIAYKIEVNKIEYHVQSRSLVPSAQCVSLFFNFLINKIIINNLIIQMSMDLKIKIF